MNKKGFTLVELIAVIVILIVLMVIALTLVNKEMDKSKVKAFLKEANTFARGAVQKQSVDRAEELATDDIFHDSQYGKVCYSITQKILDKYISKTTNTYRGSIEVCYGADCTYQTKIWITDGKHYIDGETSVEDESQIKKSFTTNYPDSCGVQAIGGGSSGDLVTANFDYTGGEQVMDIIVDGVYSLEAWGAQGGDYTFDAPGGYGAYAYDEIELHKGDKLYVNVGQKGSHAGATDSPNCYAAYNGGAKCNTDCGGGGGATHIAAKSGTLANVSVNYVYIVAGAGGGGNKNTNSYGIRRIYGGANNIWIDNWGSTRRYGGYDPNSGSFRGNGAGYYSNGAYEGTYINCGGSSYVTHNYVKNGKMYCYNCHIWDSSRTTSVNVFSDTAETGVPKVGNGYARVTYIEHFTES